MRKKRGTKSALLSSVISLLLCVSMLIGTTVAWFTDTASTGVETIQAGTLDVELEMQTGDEWVSTKGKTLDWVGENIVWQPNCEYHLPTLRVVNHGNLAVKYKLAVNAVTKGNPDLWDVLEWYVTANGEKKRLEDLPEGELPAAGTEPSVSTEYVISASLPDPLVGNYQNAKVEGISVTLLAAQLASEFDSADNTYDGDALYCALAASVNQTRDIPVESESAGTIHGMEENTSIKLGDLSSSYLKAYEQPDNTSQLTDMYGILREKITTTGGSDYVVYDISYSYKPDGSDTITPIHSFNAVIPHTFRLSKGLSNVVVTHEGRTQNADETPYSKFSYDYKAETGVLTIRSAVFSRFEVSFDYDFEAAARGQGYTSLEAAMDAALAGDTVTLLRDRSAAIQVKKSLDFDLGGHTVTCAAGSGPAFNVASDVTCSIANGAIVSTYQAIYNRGKIEALENLEMTGGGGVYNYGVIETIGTMPATDDPEDQGGKVTIDTRAKTDSVGIINGSFVDRGKIEKICNTTIQSNGVGVRNYALRDGSGSSLIDTMEGVNIDSSKNAIVNGGTINSIQGSDITSGVFGIENSSSLGTIKNTKISAANTGIFNGSGKTIGEVSGVTIEATTGISNSGVIDQISGASITASSTGISNSGTITAIEKPAITAAIGISNSGTITAIRGAEADGTIATTGVAILNNKEIGGIDHIRITSVGDYGIRNNSGATITTISGVEIAAVGIGIRNAGTIDTITASIITVSDGKGGNGDYGILNEGDGTITNTPDVTVEGNDKDAVGSLAASSPAAETSSTD